MSVVLRRFRGAKQNWKQDVALSPDTTKPFVQKLLCLIGLKYYRFELHLDMDWAVIAPGIFSLEIHDEQSGRTFHFRAAPDALGLFGGPIARTFFVFTEPSVQVVRIELHALDRHAIQRLTAKGQSALCPDPVCILGEYPDTARDNGFALFSALQNIPQTMKSFYIIDERNADNLDTGINNVLAWGSEAHIAACLDASVCAFTHHRHYVYPAILSHIAKDRYDRTQTVFLQHGVMAMKGGTVLNHYHRKRVDYDAVIVSSPREKTVFVKHFGYAAPSVHVTGLSRLDRLYNQASDRQIVKNQILVAPTWRPGLDRMSPDQIETDPYTLQWSLAIQDMKNNGLHPILIGHQILRDHVTSLENSAAESRTSKRFQETLLQSCALVTDYSSVAWDALYIGRPAFLFQFDRERVKFSQNAFITEQNLPGPVDDNAKSLVARLISAAANDWTFDAWPQREAAFQFIDAGNTERTIKLITRMAHSGAGDTRPL
ncbi:CDP-glycerol glycerophosphotransferase family protein [Loktanella sp. R86503]|uniref:CDP-glycerol glycerophosphotransferase family protein n=1 Tax=Loktanella sp. R86503 TaxID=3093847 RepID=UPI0036D80DC0